MVQKKGSVSIFFPGLPNYLSKMCLVMTRHILMLPRHNFFCLDPKFVSGHHPSFSQKDKGRQGKTWSRPYKSFLVPSPIRTHLLISCPLFWGKWGRVFIHSFIHCAISLILSPKENRHVFCLRKWGSIFIHFHALVVHANLQHALPQGKPRRKVPQCLFSLGRAFWKIARWVPVKFPNVEKRHLAKKIKLHNWLSFLRKHPKNLP